MDNYPQLNLPPIHSKIEWRSGQQYIFDTIRKKWLYLSPEEWVRQHMISYLIHYKHYPKALLKQEGAANYGSLAKRTDIVIYNSTGQAQLLIECKAASVSIGQKEIKQLLVYQHHIQASIIGLSNGLDHYFLQTNPDGSSQYLDTLPNHQPNI
jgi:hypothetical protein